MEKMLPWIALGALCACAAEPGAAEFRSAARAASEARFEEAIDRLWAAFEAGYPRPSRVLHLPEFETLRRSESHRPALFDTLQRHLPESEIVMVADDEPGRRFTLRGRILDGSTDEPIARAGVQIVHVDNDGRYAESTDVWNPRLYGFVSTGSDGRFAVTTIRPPPYPDETGSRVPAHFHFLAWADGYRQFGGEILFEDDPLLDADARRQAALNGFPIVEPRTRDDGSQEAEARILLAPLAYSGSGSR